MATTADVPQTTGICVGAVVQASPHAWGAHYAEKVGATKRYRGTVIEPGTEVDLPESCPRPWAGEPVWRVRYDDDNRVWATPERFLKVVAARLDSDDTAAPAPVAAAAHPLAALGKAMVGAVHTAASFEARSGCLAAPARPFAAYAFLERLRSSRKSDAFKRILAGAGTDLAAMRRRVTRLLRDDLDTLEDFHHLTRR